MDEKEAEHFVDALLQVVPKLFLDLFQFRVKKKRLTRKFKDELVQGVRKYVDLLQEFEASAAIPMTPQQWASRLEDASVRLGPFMDMPPGENMADYIQRSCKDLVDSPLERKYFRPFGYAKYRDCILDQVTKVVQLQRNPAVDALFAEFNQSQDAFPALQTLLSLIMKKVRYLEYDRKVFRPPTYERLIGLCGELSGLYEKLVRVSVGVEEIIDGRQVDYVELATRSLGSNVNMLMRRRPLLAKCFSTTIRNAVAHRSYYVRLSDASIAFVDRKSQKTLSAREFVSYLRTLSVAVAALALTQVAFGHARWKATWDYYGQVRAGKP
jgi:hypothetical protein